MQLAIGRAADAAEMFAAEGIVKAMNTFNAGDKESDGVDNAEQQPDQA